MVIIAIIVIIDQPECVAVDDIDVASLASVMRKILAWDWLACQNDYCEIIFGFLEDSMTGSTCIWMIIVRLFLDF